MDGFSEGLKDGDGGRDINRNKLPCLILYILLNVEREDEGVAEIDDVLLGFLQGDSAGLLDGHLACHRPTVISDGEGISLPPSPSGRRYLHFLGDLRLMRVFATRRFGLSFFTGFFWG